MVVAVVGQRAPFIIHIDHNIYIGFDDISLCPCPRWISGMKQEHIKPLQIRELDAVPICSRTGIHPAPPPYTMSIGKNRQIFLSRGDQQDSPEKYPRSGVELSLTLKD